jgi:hypothetical protein
MSAGLSPAHYHGLQVRASYLLTYRDRKEARRGNMMVHLDIADDVARAYAFCYQSDVYLGKTRRILQVAPIQANACIDKEDCDTCKAENMVSAQADALIAC